MIVAFTGHRPSKLGGYGPSPVQDAVRRAIRAFLSAYNPQEAISGMALGVDQWAAETCVELGIPFTAAVPCDGQESVWPEEGQRVFRSLIAKAQHVYVVSPGPYAVWKMQVRNKWMVNNSDILFAVWDGSSGGTANCVRYAKSLPKPVMQFNPRAA